MTESVYMQYNPWWEEKEYEPVGIIERTSVLNKVEKWMKDKPIIILTGLRRVGKTTVMKQLIRKLIRDGVKPADIFYVSLDDYALGSRSVLDIVEEYRTLQKLPVDRKVYLFLDEVAYKDRFHQQLKNLYDRQNVKIVASSSSRSVLRDKGAFLTGREIVIKIFPLEFSEYLDFRNIEIKKRDSHLIPKHFEDYLQTGGLPGYVLTREREYLQTVVDDIIYKDIIAYHSIRNQQLVKEFFLLLMERAGKQMSINKMSNILKMSPDTAKRYLGLFEETYLIYTVSRHGSTNEQLLSPPKMYASDLGIRHLFTGFRDKGSIFENYVYLLIKNRNPQFVNYVYENGIEIDFFIDKHLLVEVKYDRSLNEKQEMLFKNFNAEEKLVVGNRKDITELEIYFEKRQYI
jgi:predicted AAA+ superfamily ATPase